MAQTDVADRNLTTARELRAAAAETRQALRISRELVERSRRQTLALALPEYEQAAGTDQPNPSRLLVECLIQAYELAEADGELQTRALLSHVLMHVGRRVAAILGPSAAKVGVH